jgi:ribonuclease-3 family protein
LPVKQASNINTLVLAMVGDAVETLYVRTELTLRADFKAGELHRQTSAVVNANAQAQLMERLLPLLNPDERAVYIRARNSKSNNVPKNTELSDYKKATGFEAVLGFLYLTGQNGRLAELLQDNFE